MAALDSQNCQVWALETTHGCWDIPEDTPPETIQFWNRVASDYLWQMTGRRLGPSCPLTIRPCLKRCADNYGIGRFLNQGQYQSTGPWIPYMVDGQMRNASLCGCVRDCHCGPELCQIDLVDPVYDVTNVRVDGIDVPSSTYTVIDARYLTRVNDGIAGEEPRCWPSCQDLTLTDAHPGTFSVTYRTGLTLSGLAHAAVTMLTAHFIKGCSGGCGCGVGTRQNLSRLSRQGVDLEFADPQQLFDDGRTGIELVDFFIRGANPYGLGSQMRVLSPDAPKRGVIWGGVV